MASIPISTIVKVTPSVLSAGAPSLELIGLVLTTSSRVPIGQVLSFPNSASVGTYFGLTTTEYSIAATYFSGFVNNNTTPGALLFSQYPQVAVAAYVRGAALTQLTLAQVQALSGTLTVIMDGYTHSAGTVNLSAATSYSNAASLINTALTATEPTEASVTAAMGASFTATSSGSPATTFTVTAVTGYISAGDAVTGTGAPGGTTIASFVSGTPGGAGVYLTNQATTCSSASCTSTSNVMNITAVGSGTPSVGQTAIGGSLAAGSVLTATVGTIGVGGTGLYTVSGAQQSQASGTVTLKATAPSVSFDTTSGAIVITSGITGAPSTSAYATGTLAASVFLTSATGAVLSQGAAAANPAAYMTALTLVNINWATFMTAFDPDALGSTGNTLKLAFATWNSQQNSEFAYVCWDTDVTPTLSSPASASLGQLLAAANTSGTILVWDNLNTYLTGAFICGWAASINTNQRNGRTTLAFRQSSGSLQPAVTSATAGANLLANGYSYYGLYANPTILGSILYNGSISGPFLWADSFINQIWLNNAFQNSLWSLLLQMNSIPYNVSGDDLIRAALIGPLRAAINFGAIVTGVQLSPLMIAELQAAAGFDISPMLYNQGYYILIVDAISSVRAARKSPAVIVWYVDGQSVQSLNLSSVEVQ